MSQNWSRHLLIVEIFGGTLEKLITLDDLQSLRRSLRSQTVCTWLAGKLDRLDGEQVRLLREAKRTGDILLVAICGVATPDDLDLAASLGIVDYVIRVDSSDAEFLISRLQPDVLCIAPKSSERWDTLSRLIKIVENRGGRVLFPASASDSVQGFLADVRENSGPSVIQLGESNRDPSPSLVDRFSRARALVVGDVMLDEYVTGSIARISPEAPVPVLDVLHRRFTCGGAANVAANMASLSGTSYLAGVTGNDTAAGILRRCLTEYGIRLDALIESPEAQTICKTRIIAGQQQIVRVDQERHRPPSDIERAELVDNLVALMSEIDVCVVSDYAKGLLDDRMCGDVIRMSLDQGKPTIVDPKGSNFTKYRGCTVITPNAREAGIAAGFEIKTDEQLEAAGSALLAMLPGTAILITRGPDGMTLFRDSLPPLTIPTVARTVFDVVGAGDTAVAALSIALGARFALEDAIRLANIAAGIAVEHRGTVAVGIDELAARPEAIQVLMEDARSRIANLVVN